MEPQKEAATFRAQAVETWRTRAARAGLRRRGERLLTSFTTSAFLRRPGVFHVMGVLVQHL
eukprot:5481732-Amphidinium_carterae.1